MLDAIMATQLNASLAVFEYGERNFSSRTSLGRESPSELLSRKGIRHWYYNQEQLLVRKSRKR